MTTVIYERDADSFTLICTGHAGYETCGKDIVCAGITTLCAALEIALDNLQDKGMTLTHICTWAGDTFRAEATAVPMNIGVETAFDVVFDGLCRLEEGYSPYLQCRRYMKEKEMTA